MPPVFPITSGHHYFSSGLQQHLISNLPDFIMHNAANVVFLKINYDCGTLYSPLTFRKHSAFLIWYQGLTWSFLTKVSSSSVTTHCITTPGIGYHLKFSNSKSSLGLTALPCECFVSTLTCCLTLACSIITCEFSCYLLLGVHQKCLSLV